MYTLVSEIRGNKLPSYILVSSVLKMEVKEVIKVG